MATETAENSGGEVIVPPHVSLQEAARALGLRPHSLHCWSAARDPKTLAQWARLGAFKLYGRWRFYRHVLRAIVEEAPQAVGLARPSQRAHKLPPARLTGAISLQTPGRSYSTLDRGRTDEDESVTGPDPTTWLTVKEVAERLGVDIAMLRRYIGSGYLPEFEIRQFGPTRISEGSIEAGRQALERWRAMSVVERIATVKLRNAAERQRGRGSARKGRRALP